MIRRRLVVGIQNLKLSEQLQMAQTWLWKRQKANTSMWSCSRAPDNPSASWKFRQTTSSWTNPSQEKTQSSTCYIVIHQHNSRAAHAFNKSLARESTCYKCKRKGHYSSQCFSKTVLEVTAGQPEEDIDVTYLSVIVSEKDSCWTVNIEINGKPMIFKSDTGTEVTAIT